MVVNILEFYSPKRSLFLCNKMLRLRFQMADTHVSMSNSNGIVVPLVGLQCVIVAHPGHTHFLYWLH